MSQREATDEALRFKAPAFSSSDSANLLTPHALELGHLAYQEARNYYVWKVDSNNAWVMRKKFAKTTSTVIRICRVRVVSLVEVEGRPHVACSCKGWTMDGHGCRHVTWACGDVPSCTFFHPVWTKAHVRCYGRAEFEGYTSAVDQLLRQGLPGPFASSWASVPIDFVAHAGDPVQVKALMRRVKGSPSPVLVTNNGDLQFGAEAISTRGLDVYDFMDSHVEINADSFSPSPLPPAEAARTNAFNEFKAEIATLAGIVEQYPELQTEIGGELRKLRLKWQGWANDKAGVPRARNALVTGGSSCIVSSNPTLNTKRTYVPRGGKW